jgi:predicted transposase/invertase (TIGR01784 family)
MRRDSIFYQLFRQLPTLLFELIPHPPDNAERYTFDSVEVKETAFRIDGVFIPPNASEIIYFCEVQFQLDKLLYERMLSEISIYTYRHRNSFSDWRAVVIYPDRSLEQLNKSVVSEMLASGRIIPIYLDELETGSDLSTGLNLMLLTILEGDEAKLEAKRMIQQSRPLDDGRVIIDLISTIMVYKFNNLSRDEVDGMLGIKLEQTRVYQDAKAEGETIGLERGRTEGEQVLVLKQLIRKLGTIKPEIKARVNSLKSEQLESLGEDLLDFTQMIDLLAWLDVNN